MQITFAGDPEQGTLLIRLFEQGTVPEPHKIFSGKKGETWWENENELWLGTGEKPSPASLQKTVRKLFHQRKHDWPPQVSVDITGADALQLEAIVNGIVTGGYDIQLYKTAPKPLSPLFGENGRVFLMTSPENTSLLRDTLQKASETASVQLRIMDLMNAPANKKNAGTLARWALESGETYGYDVTVLDQTGLAENGFSALLAVNQGSPEDAALIVAQYTPETYEKTVALVGKGVTFDTGGISIKPGHNMHLMKSDMGGAAAVLGTVELAARLRLPVKLIGIIPATENCVDGAALRPGDVIGSYSGRTIEVIDTDAEGRLILADGLSYAVREFKPDIVIDLATLTGSVIQTLGYHAAGLFTQNNGLAEALEEAGTATGERLWRLPLWDDYKDEIDSDIADVKNYHGKPLAGAIVAAKFLEVFTDGHPAWAHLDIAGTAFGDTDFVPGRAGTAFGIRLLRRFLENPDEARSHALVP